MVKEGNCVLIIVMFACAGDTGAAGLPEMLLIDDASREILFLDLYRRVSALETRTQMSDAIDWTQQTQFDRLKLLAENQQQWLKDLEAVARPNGRCEKPATMKRAAFTAYLDHDIDSSGESQVIVFNQVFLNEGGYYDAASGIFTCPWDGVYDISFFLGQRGESGSTKYVRSRLYVNDKEIVMAVVDASHAGQDLQGGNRVILRLTKGDAVKVMVLGKGWHIEGDTHRTTTFTGVYLFD